MTRSFIYDVGVTTDTSPRKDARPYHHGDLRRALLEAALQAISEVGPAAVSLRDLARRTGVSHAAPAHHFGDKAGLLTAVAADGFRRLAATLREVYQATGSFLEVGVAYVGFAVTHRAYFEVMFRLELYRPDDPELVQARDQARALLYPPAAEAANTRDSDGDMRAGVAAWSLVHGLATLWLNRNLPPQLGDDPEQITRDVARHLF
jgi:AcrR family transcriptional regulator